MRAGFVCITKENAIDTREQTATAHEDLIDAASGLLGQCRQIVDAMGDDSFCCASEVLAGGTIGKHLRHTLDHFGAIIDGVRRDETIEYDHRARGVAVETDRAAATGRITDLRDGIAALAAGFDSPVRIRVMLSGDGTETEIESTVAREVAFATHHGIHHVAMMKAIATEMGVSFEGDIGKAPSTIQHERSSVTGDRAGA